MCHSQHYYTYTHANSNGNTYGDAYSDTDCYTYSHAYGYPHRNADINANADAYANSYANGDANSDTHPNPNANSNAYTYPDAWRDHAQCAWAQGAGQAHGGSLDILYPTLGASRHSEAATTKRRAPLARKVDRPLRGRCQINAASPPLFSIEQGTARSTIARPAPRSLSVLSIALLQRRTAKPHSHFIGAILCARFAYLVRVTHVASSDADEVLIGATVGHRGDHYSIAVDVDVGRGYRRPC
jgi:hypothetical protein